MPPGGDAESFHIGPHAPTIPASDVQLVHRLWLNLRRDPDMEQLHHSDIVTYALTRLASEFATDKEGTAVELLRNIKDGGQRRGLGSTSRFEDISEAAPGYSLTELAERK